VSEYTRPATWDDVTHLARRLAEAGASYALIGGYALAAHGFNRFSEDIDLLVDPAPGNVEKIIAVLAELPDGAARELSPNEFSGPGPCAVRVNDEFTVDLMPAACGHQWAELAAFIETIDVDGVALRLLSKRGLLLTKEGMREKDKADAMVLRRVLGLDA
jgi:hypothetical protein